jgi:hypothetical protein
VAALVPDIFATFIFQENHKIADNTASTESRQKMNTDFESLEFLKFFDACLTSFKNNQILLNKISH